MTTNTLFKTIIVLSRFSCSCMIHIDKKLVKGLYGKGKKIERSESVSKKVVESTQHMNLQRGGNSAFATVTNTVVRSSPHKSTKSTVKTNLVNRQTMLEDFDKRAVRSVLVTEVSAASPNDMSHVTKIQKLLICLIEPNMFRYRQMFRLREQLTILK